MDVTFLVQSLIDGILTGGVYALVAIGLTMIFGVMHIINFAHGSFMMLGMYASYFMFTYIGIDPYVSILLIMPLFFVMGFIVQSQVLQKIIHYPGETILLLTMGIMLVIDNMALAIWSPNYRTITTSYGSFAFYALGLKVNLTRLIAFVLAILMGALLYLLLKKTYLGKAIRAVSQEKEGALAVGINFNRIFCIAFGDNLAVVQHNDAVGYLICACHIVSNNNACNAELSL